MRHEKAILALVIIQIVVSILALILTFCLLTGRVGITIHHRGLPSPPIIPGGY